MAKPCKITYTPKGGNPREYNYAEFMTSLKEGLFAELVKSGSINPNAMKGDNPFVSDGGKPKSKPATQKPSISAMSDFMKEDLNQAYGDIKASSYSARAKEQRGLSDKDYVSYDRAALNAVADKKFRELFERYNAGEKKVFDDLLEAADLLTDRERKDFPLIDPMYQVVLAKAANHFYLSGNIAYSDKITREKSASFSAKGQSISTANALTSTEELANRLRSEDSQRRAFLDRVISGEMTIGEAIAEIVAIARLDANQISGIVARVMPKIQTKKVAPVKTKQQDARRAEVQAIREILARRSQPSAERTGQASAQRTGAIPSEIIPHIESLAKSYAEESVSMSQIKSRVWANLRSLIPGSKAEIDSLIDSMSSSLEADIVANKKASAESRLVKALEGSLDEPDASRKRAIKILSDTLLENDPEYARAKSNGEKVKAKDRLKILLRDKQVSMEALIGASDIAKANIDANETINAATKQAIKNAIDDAVSDISGLPVGKSEIRSASSALSDDDVKKRIEEIATRHYGDPSPEIRSLAEELVEELGIDPAYADEIQNYVQQEVADAVAKRMDKESDRIDRIVGDVIDGKEVRKAVLNAITKGELTGTALGDALMDALGYRGFSNKDIETLKNYFTRLQQLNPGEELYQQINRYINDVLAEYDETTAALIGRWLTEQMYISALSSIMNTAVMASGIGAVVSSLQHGAFTLVMNPSRMAKAISYARKMKKNKATMGWETVAAKWQKPESQFGETTLLERPQEKAHGAVTRVTQRKFSEILDDIIRAKGGRKGYFVAQAILKAINHAVTFSGSRKRKWMPSFSQISMTMMSAQDILMGGFLQDMHAYIEAEKYVDTMNKVSGAPVKKGTKLWDSYKKSMIDEILSTDPAKIAKMKAEVDQEAMDMVSKGESLPKGWARRRLRDKIHNAMPGEVVNEMAHQAKKALLLQKPETSLGAWLFEGISRAQGIKDSDDAGRVLGKTVLNMTLGFMRLNVIVAEYSWKTVPVVSAAAKIAKGKNIRYVDGKRADTDMTTEDKVNVVLKNAAATMVWAALISSMFDYDEEEERITLDPNAPIKFYGSAQDSKQRAEIEAQGGKENSINIMGTNISLMTMGFAIGSIGKILGEVSNDVRFSKDESAQLSIDKILALIVGQMTGSEMSAPKRALDKVYRGYGDPKAGEALEILFLDGIETAISPSQIEQIKNDYDAWKGFQKEKRSGIIDNIVEDIYFLDAFMDTNGGKMYDHFGQPVYVTPKTQIITFLLPENMWRDGTSHVENSPYYNLTKEKWFPKTYTSWSAKAWTDVRVAGKDYELPIDEEFKQPISLIIDRATSAIIDSKMEQITKIEDENKRVERLKQYRQDAVDDVRNDFEKLVKLELSKKGLKGADEETVRNAVEEARDKVITDMRKQYGIDQ